MEQLPHEAKHADTLRSLAAECTLFLKKDGAFPINKPCSVALYGNGARNTLKGGTGSGDVYSRRFATVESGLKDAGFTVTTTAWLDAYDKERAARHPDFIKDILTYAEKENIHPFIAGMGKIEPEYDYTLPLDYDGDICIYVLARVSGEGGDRKPLPGDVKLTQTEINDILQLNNRFARFMLVLNVGGVVDITPVNGVKNILYLSQLGTVTGNVLTDIILGKAYPSGKLTTTWAATEMYGANIDADDIDDTRYNEGIYVGYRYFDTAGVTPLYPFGFGLGYTDFCIDGINAAVQGSTVTVNAQVTNTGSFNGKEVVQVYVSCPQGKLGKPYQVLAAYGKTNELAPKASCGISLSFDLRDIASYSEDAAAYMLEKGDYVLRAGNSSRSTTEVAILRIKQTVITKQVKNLLGKTDFEDITLPCNNGAKSRLPIFEIDGIPVQTCDYCYNPDIEPCLNGFTNPELAYLCVGAYMTGEQAAVIGNSGFHVAGAAGETTCFIKEKTGGAYAVMADGPAGLRISREWVQNADGTARTAQPKLPDGSDELMPEGVNLAIRQAYDAIPKEQLKQQYTTAIPIGTALAQSWSISVAEQCGDIVGAEMELYNVDLWLAPALNIHRSILCGRNFEYYSEEPLVSGLTAAAVTRGVQAHKGRGVTVKHFAANNRETNRFNNNSIVSERAMREIYLKGFELAIRYGNPKALMTSYNLLNGEHTSQRHDLCTDILRCEFGYTGITVTDWIPTGTLYNPKAKHPPIYASKIIAAGNGIVMPGTQQDVDDILCALDNGTLTREQLLQSASTVYKAITALKNK